MILLLILLNIAHFLGDYTHLSTKKMLEAKRIGSPLMLIAFHSAVHAVLFAIILVFYTEGLIFGICIWVEFISHFAIDVLKGKLNVWFPSLSNPANKFHWYIFGLDQLAHQLIIILIVYLIWK